MSGVRSSVVPFSLLKVLRAWTIVLVLAPVLSGYRWNSNSNNGYNSAQQNSLMPEFDDILIREIDATVGQTLLLPCTVKHLGDKVVSWIRSKDLHILTSGRHTFSTDNRFESVHSSSSGDFWGLRIRGVHISDTGQYECQVNTDPKMSLAIFLNVQVSGVRDSKFVSKALIKGPRELRVTLGSPVTLTCEISPMSLASLRLGNPQDESSRDSAAGASGLFYRDNPSVRWLHDGQEVTSFEESNNNAIIKSAYTDNKIRLISTLSFPFVTWKDSGQYTCMQPSTKEDRVQLTIIEGEHSEAMQRDFPISSGVPTKPTTIPLLINIHLAYNLYHILLYLNKLL